MRKNVLYNSFVVFYTLYMVYSYFLQNKIKRISFVYNFCIKYFFHIPHGFKDIL